MKDIATGKLLECLADADEGLGRSDAGNGFEVMSEVDANGTDWSGITQTDTDVVRIKRREIVKADARKHIAAVVERNDAEALLDGQRNARFCVDDEQLVAAAGNVDLRAVGSQVRRLYCRQLCFAADRRRRGGSPAANRRRR